MNAEQFKAAQKAMPNKELVKLVKKQISKLAKTGGQSHTMTVPPRVDDTDMLLSELVVRFKDLEAELERVKGRLSNILEANKDLGSALQDEMGKLKQAQAENERLDKLFSAAKNYIDECPCDPDITEGQLKAWLEYQSLLKEKE